MRGEITFANLVSLLRISCPWASSLWHAVGFHRQFFFIDNQTTLNHFHVHVFPTVSYKTEFGWYKNAGNANWTFICILLEIYILTTSKQASLSPTTALAVCQVSLAATHGGSSSYKMGEISPIATHSLSGQECLQGLTHGSSSPSSWTSSSSSSSPYSSPSARWSRIR